MPSIYTKFFSLALLAVLIVVGLYYSFSQNFFFGQRNTDNQNLSGENITNQEAPTVMVRLSPLVNGIPAIPQDFPQEIPLEAGKVTKSATTFYLDQNAKQLSLSYQSGKTVVQKYAEYKNYLTQAGYQVTEGDSKAPIRSIYGTKGRNNLSFVISTVTGGTLVQIAYLSY